MAKLRGLWKGAGVEDFAWLARYDTLLANMYVVDDSGHTATQAELLDKLPWPVVLLLGSHSRKHIFSSGRRLSLQETTRSCQDFSNRLKWRWKFKHTPDRDENDRSEEQLVKRRPREFRGTTRAAVDIFASEFKSFIVGESKKANSRIARNRSKHMKPGFVAYALKWLQKSGLAVVPSDKDGVFTICSLAVLQTMVERKLLSPCYRPVYNGMPEHCKKLMSSSVDSFGLQLRGLGFKSWAREVSEVFYSVAKDLTSPILCTIKTHKPPGDLSVRVIHSSCKSSLAAVSRIVHVWLTEVIRSDHHITNCLCVDSAEVVKRLGEWQFVGDVVFCKLDIKDFYMSGEHDVLIGAVVPMVLPERRELLEAMLWCLLRNQFVKHGDITFQVMEGSGMGQIHSGTLSDLALWSLVERNLVAGMHGLGIYGYLRFRDDSFLVGRDAQSIAEFVKKFETGTKGIWKVEVGPVERYSCPFLDLSIYKGPRFHASGKLDHVPYTKPTARHVVLSSRSAHAQSVHRNWPISEMVRMHRLSSSARASLFYRERKLKRFRLFFLPASTISRCKAWRPLIPIRSGEYRSPCDVLRLCLRFHETRRNLGTKIRDFVSGWMQPNVGLFHELGEIRLQLAYSSAGRGLVGLVRPS